MSEETVLAGRPPPHDGLPADRRRWAVAAIFSALAVASLDTAIANIALPAIAADLHVSPADVIWVVNVYQIALVTTGPSLDKNVWIRTPEILRPQMALMLACGASGSCKTQPKP